MKHLARLIALGAIIGGCNDPTMPARVPFYDFRNGDGSIFHWPVGATVFFWVEDKGALLNYVESGVSSWEFQFLYSEFSGRVIADSSNADVMVFMTGGPPPAAEINADPPVRACFGNTQIFTDGAVTQLTEAVRVTLTWEATFAPTDIANCLSRTTAHELGHAIGILNHSLDVDDLMFANPEVTSPSRADRNTVERLYHTEPTVEPGARQ